MSKGTVNRWTLAVVVLLISALFLTMIRQFIMPLILAGIFSALSYPIIVLSFLGIELLGMRFRVRWRAADSSNCCRPAASPPGGSGTSA